MVWHFVCHSVFSMKCHSLHYCIFFIQVMRFSKTMHKNVNIYPDTIKVKVCLCMVAYNLSVVSLKYYKFLIITVNCGVILLMAVKFGLLLKEKNVARALENMLWTAVQWGIFCTFLFLSEILFAATLLYFWWNTRCIPHFLYLYILSFMFFSCTVMHRCIFIPFRTLLWHPTDEWFTIWL